MPKRPMNEAMLERVAARFRTLGEPMRLRLLQALESGEKTVGEMVALTAASQPNVSQHLQELFQAGLVGRRKAGTSVFYWIADPLVFRLCDLVCTGTEVAVRNELEQLRGSAIRGK